MLKLLFNRKKISKEIAKDIASETQQSFNKILTSQDQKHDQILKVLETLTNKVTHLENQMMTKELQDKQNYGHMQYKISELQSDMIFEGKKIKS